MNCLILGGAGFIGSHLADALTRRGHRVRVFDRPGVCLNNLNQSMDLVEILTGDFNDPDDLTPAIDGMEVLVHLISNTIPSTSNQDPVWDIKSNVIGTVNLLEKAVKHGVQKVVFASSGGTVYGIPQTLPISETHQTNPICSYGITKLAIEKYLALFNHLYGLEYVVLRFGNPYGMRQPIESKQGAIGVFLGKVLQGETITIWGDGSVARDYFYVSDLVSACTRVIEGRPRFKIFNIAGGNACSLREILAIVTKVTGRKPKVEFKEGRKLDVPVNCLDIRRAGMELDWFPRVSLIDGVSTTWEWLKMSRSSEVAFLPSERSQSANSRWRESRWSL